MVSLAAPAPDTPCAHAERRKRNCDSTCHSHAPRFYFPSRRPVPEPDSSGRNEGADRREWRGHLCGATARQPAGCSLWFDRAPQSCGPRLPHTAARIEKAGRDPLGTQARAEPTSSEPCADWYTLLLLLLHSAWLIIVRMRCGSGEYTADVGSVARRGAGVGSVRRALSRRRRGQLCWRTR